MSRLVSFLKTLDTLRNFSSHKVISLKILSISLRSTMATSRSRSTSTRRREPSLKRRERGKLREKKPLRVTTLAREVSKR